MNLSNITKTEYGYMQCRGRDMAAYHYSGEDAEVLDLVFKYMRRFN